jgi:cobalt-zinc-cadmium efflux system outer membrane protein
MRHYHSAKAICGTVAAALLFVRTACADVSAEPLTLPHVLALALARNPDLAGFAAEVRARAARSIQVGRMPNPELRADLENVGGSGEREAFEQTETTVRVSQRIELGGKRGGRQRIAELDRDVAAWDYQARARAVLSDTTKAFVHTLAAQERVAVAAQLEELARGAVESATGQVDAGASPAVDITRARVALGRSELEKQRAERELESARRALAANWGDEQPTFGRLEGDLTALRPPPSLHDIETDLERSPYLARAASETEERGATLTLERAARIPDVTVGAGARHFSDNGDVALIFELSAPLPVFDRNQGGIAEAQSRLEKTRAETDALRLSLRAALATANAELSTAYDQAIRLRERVIPTAQRAFDETRAAYRQGLLRSIDVLDAQRTLFQLRGDYLTVLENFHVAAAEFERLTGRSLSEAPALEEIR